MTVVVEDIVVIILTAIIHLVAMISMKKKAVHNGAYENK